MYRFLQSIALATALSIGGLAFTSARAQNQSEAPPSTPQHHPHRPGQPTTPAAPGTPTSQATPAGVLGTAPQNTAPGREHLPRPRSAPIASPSRSPKNSTGEEFFIIASIDQAHSQVLLKHPTEVTQLMQLTPKTKYVDENGKAVRLQDFRAGDTVWVLSSGGGLEPDVVRIRKGQMTVADLHRYYLDYAEIR